MKTFTTVLLILMVGFGAEAGISEPGKEQEYKIPTVEVEKEKPLFRTKWNLVDSDFQQLKFKWKLNKFYLDYDIKEGWWERTEFELVTRLNPHLNRVPDISWGFSIVVEF